MSLWERQACRVCRTRHFTAESFALHAESAAHRRALLIFEFVSNFGTFDNVQREPCSGSPCPTLFHP